MIRIYWMARNGMACVRTLGKEEVLADVMKRLHQHRIYASALEVDPQTGYLTRLVGAVMKHPDTGKRVWWSE